MRRVRCLMVLVLIGLPWIASAGENDDKSKLQGVWNATGLTDKGRAEDPAKVRTLKLVVKGDKYIYEFESGTKKFEATFTLNPKANPKTIDVQFMEGPLKGRIMKAIYTLEGNDFKICGASEKRPTEFTSTAENQWIMFNFKRAKK
jgi:uncharacterized protein (TIGR03067 family)